MVAQGELLRVRRGLYYKGAQTALGMTEPHPMDVALVVGGTGSGPAGFSAAAWLRMTTQVPGVLEVAVPTGGWMPVAPAGVLFTRRTQSRREFALRPTEVAVLEVLRDWPLTVESSWDVLVERVVQLIDAGALRRAVLAKVVAATCQAAEREGWRQLVDGMGTRAAKGR
jgi:hypothetical protein